MYNLYPARVSHLYSRDFHKDCTSAVEAMAIVYNIQSIVFGKVVIHLCGKTVLRISQKLDRHFGPHVCAILGFAFEHFSLASVIFPSLQYNVLVCVPPQVLLHYYKKE